MTPCPELAAVDRAELTAAVVAAEAEAADEAIAARDAMPDEGPPPPPRIRYRAPELVAHLAAIADLAWVPIRVGDLPDDEIARLPVGAVVPITAASGAGKTTLTLAVLVHHALDIGPAVLVSLELSHAEVAARIVGIRRGISWSEAMRGGDSDDARRALDALPRLVVLAEDDATISKAEAAIAALRAEHPDQPIVVAFDYLQIMEGDPRARDERAKVAAGAESIRRFAKRAQVLALMISQSSRAGANALRKGESIGADTATTGAESSQIERGAYLTIAIGEAVARDDGSADVSLSIGKARFGGGDRVIPCRFDGASGRWRVTGAGVTAAEHRANRDADRDSGRVEAARLAVLGKLGTAPGPMSKNEVAVGITVGGIKREHVYRAIGLLLGSGELVAVAGRKRGGAWPVWTPDRAAAAGMRTIDKGAP